MDVPPGSAVPFMLQEAHSSGHAARWRRVPFTPPGGAEFRSRRQVPQSAAHYESLEETSNFLLLSSHFLPQ